MQDDELKDDELFIIMKKGKRTMPFHDFDDRVMTRIHEETTYKNVISSKLKLSLIFFVIGIASGVALTISFSVFGKPVLGINPETLALPILFVIAVIAIMTLDNFLRLIKKYNH